MVFYEEEDIKPGTCEDTLVNFFVVSYRTFWVYRLTMSDIIAQSEGKTKACYILQGGFRAFSSIYPFRCTGTRVPPSPDLFEYEQILHRAVLTSSRIYPTELVLEKNDDKYSMHWLPVTLIARLFVPRIRTQCIVSDSTKELTDYSYRAIVLQDVVKCTW